MTAIKRKRLCLYRSYSLEGAERSTEMDVTILCPGRSVLLSIFKFIRATENHGSVLLERVFNNVLFSKIPWEDG